MTENYRGCYEYLSAQYPEVGGYEFYKELFPDNENSGERHTDFSHPNAVYLYRDEQSEDKKLRRRKMYNDTWEQDYMEFVEGNSLTLCSGLAYRRKENRMERKSRQQEINEALMAADMASMSLQKAEEQLQKASSWGIWDMLGGGFFSTMFKHNRMDEAQAAMNEARGHLRRLKKELLDVNLTGDLKMDVGSFLTFADYFFDGVIADWMVQSKIGDALNQVREARRQVGCIRKRLQEMRQTLEAEREGR